MNLIKMLLWIVFLGVNVMASDKTVDIQEKLWPPQSGPLKNIGNVTLSETDVNGKVFMSHRDMWTVQNVSQRPIVAIAETLLIGYPNGHTVSVGARHDMFFHTNIMNPGDTIELSVGANFGTQIADANPSHRVEPLCEVRSGWVQFADGSTFGDPKEAVELLKNRKAILYRLQELDETYKSQGSEKFVAQLQQRVEPPEVDGFFLHLRKYYELERDLAGTVERLEMHLTQGQERMPILVPIQSQP